MLSETLKGIFPPKASLKRIGEQFKIVDIKRFNHAKFSVVNTNAERGRHVSTLSELGIKEGDILKYAGRGSGAKKMYILAFGDKFNQIEIHMSHLADGNPESFGLQKYVGPDVNPNHVQHPHHPPLDAKLD